MRQLHSQSSQVITARAACDVLSSWGEGSGGDLKICAATQASAAPLEKVSRKPGELEVWKNNVCITIIPIMHNMLTGS